MTISPLYPFTLLFSISFLLTMADCGAEVLPSPAEAAAGGDLAAVETVAGDAGVEDTAEAEPEGTPAAELTEVLAEREAELDQRERELDLRQAQLERDVADLERRMQKIEQDRRPEPSAPVAREPLPAAVEEPPAAAIEAAAEPRPSARITLPEGLTMEVELLDALSSRENVAGDPFSARVRSDVLVAGEVAVAAGSVVRGRVLEAVPAKKIGGRAKLALAFTDLEALGSESTAIEADFALAGRKTTKRDALTIGGAAAGGAILGSVVDDNEGTVIGAIVGAAAGAAIAAKDRPEVELVPGTPFELQLQRPVYLVRR